MREFAELSAAREAWLAERVRAQALARGYGRYVTAMRPAWKTVVARAVRALAASPREGARLAERAQEVFSAEDARRHREQGVSLGEFLGMLFAVRQGFLNLIEADAADATALAQGGRLVVDFFDSICATAVLSWNAAEGEASPEDRRARHERRRLIAVFRALPAPVVLTDAAGRVVELNDAACQWLKSCPAGGGPAGGGPTGEGPSDECPVAEDVCRDDFRGRRAEDLLPWIAPTLERMRRGVYDPESVLGPGRAGEHLSFLDTRIFPLLDVDGRFDGLIAVIQDVSAQRDAAETQARIASDLRAQLRQAACLNCMGEMYAGQTGGVDGVLETAARFLPRCWTTDGGVAARIVFDGRAYGPPADDEASAVLAAPLSVLGQDRGRLELRASGRSFPSGDADLLAKIAEQTRHVLENRLTLSLLARSERQFREFFNNAADAILIVDEAGDILDANKNAAIWLGHAQADLAGAKIFDFLAADDRETATARLRSALRDEPELFQASIVRRDGFAAPAEVLCQKQDYRGRPAVVMSARNIAGRLRVQAEIVRRLELEGIAAAVSGRLIGAGGGTFAAAMEESLGDLCRFTGMRRAGIYLLDAVRKRAALTHQWREAAAAPLPKSQHSLSAGRMPWLMERLGAGERVFVSNVEALPPAGRKERRLWTEAGIASVAVLPMNVENRLLGALVLASDVQKDAAQRSGAALLEQAALLFANSIARRDAALALRQSESLARAILDALPSAICVLDTRGRLTMLNRSWDAAGRRSTPLGDRGRSLGLGDNYLEACLEADNPHAAQAREGILAVLSRRARSFAMEYPGQATGDRRWFALQATPFARGERGAVVAHSDITQRRRAVEELRESEERFRIIVETAQEGVVRINDALFITYANPRLCELLGYGVEELLALTLPEVVDTLDHGLLQEKIKRRRQGRSDQYELRFRHKSGRRIWTIISASPVRGPGGVVEGSIGMITDISDRVADAARLRRNEARYRSLVESMHEGLVMTRKNGVVNYVNERFCAILGRGREAIIGRPAVSLADEGSRERLSRMLTRGAVQASAEEVLWEHSDGRHVYSLVSPSALIDENGRITGFFAVVTDTTERKNLESQLLQSQKLEAIGQLAAGIAHEINTPAQYVGNNIQFIKGAFEDMSAVLAAARDFVAAAGKTAPAAGDVAAFEDLMVERDVEYLVEETPRAIAQTLEGVERISTIVRSVKQFAHPGIASMAPADLNESMESTVTVSRNEWKYVAELDLDLDPKLPTVICMIGEINQVVLNLIINAAHAIADAKKVDPDRPGRITLSTRLAPPWAEIRVSDTGTGVPADVRGRIFDPFFTTKEVGRGTGQGLTISRSIVVDKHKGQLFFETEEGRGTTFVVRLPLDVAEGER